MLAPTPSHESATPARNALTADEIVARLELAGRTLLALPRTGYSTKLVQSGMEWVREADETCVQPRARIRPAVPDAATITLMDEALAWIPLIPVEQYVLRRIVGARSLIDPMNGRHMFSWRRLGVAIGADHKAVKQWHAKAIGIIASRLRAPSRELGRSLPQAARHHCRRDP